MAEFRVNGSYTKVVGDPIELARIDGFLSFKKDTKFNRGIRDGEDDGYFRLLLRPENLIFTGLLKYLVPLMEAGDMEYGITGYVPGSDIGPPPTTTLSELLDIERRDYQEMAFVKCIMRKYGVIDIPTGGGKTEIGIGVIKYVDQQSLYLVDSVSLMHQTIERMRKRGIKDVGGYGDNLRQIHCKVVVGMVDSLLSGVLNGEQPVWEFLKETKVLILDEVHHLPADGWTKVAVSTEPEYKIGFSATPLTHFDTLGVRDYILLGVVGEVIVSIPYKYLWTLGYISEPHTFIAEISFPLVRGYNWPDIYGNGIVRNVYRNNYITNIAESMYNIGMKTLISTFQIEHGISLLALLNNPETWFLWGGGNAARIENGHLKFLKLKATEFNKTFESMPRGILIGSSVYDEGMDLPSVNCCIIAGGYKSYRMTLQRPGRTLRAKDDCNRSYIFDFRDAFNSTLCRHSDERIDGYRSKEFFLYGMQDLQRIVGAVVPVPSISPSLNILARQNLANVLIEEWRKEKDRRDKEKEK